MFHLVYDTDLRQREDNLTEWRIQVFIKEEARLYDIFKSSDYGLGGTKE